MIPALVLIPFGTLSVPLFPAVGNARTESIVPPISATLLSSEGQPSSEISTTMEAQSPGGPNTRLVHHQDVHKRILIAVIVSSTLVGAVLLFLSCCWIYRQKRNTNEERPQSFDTAKGLPLRKFNVLRTTGMKSAASFIEYELLEDATNSFHESNILEKGGREFVYKARLEENLHAVVKRLDGGGGVSEFENEVNCLSNVQHQNVVTLLGYCLHGETRLLVYEMMENGSLESQLHGPSHGSALTWKLRMKIALDIARGLEYLHEHCHPSLIHRDLKSSNILLDSSFNAKLSDFGLAITAGTQIKKIKLSGTLGYVAPEYLLDGKLTDKSDVYAFGIILLELLMGRKPVEQMAQSQYQSIVTWAMPQLTDRSKLPNIVDPTIRNTMDLKHLYQVAAVAVLCVQPEPSYRPLITDVLHSFIPLVPVKLGGSLRSGGSEPPSP